MSPAINSSVAGDGPPVVLVHGLFGSGGNLGALSRALRDRYRIYSIDLPNHGRSAWMEDATVENMAQAVIKWMAGQGIGSARLVGHSLGGKVCMGVALARPQRVAALVVADIAPVAYPPGHDAVFAALDAVTAANVGSRAEAQEIMAMHLEEHDVIQFLLASLQRTKDGGYSWRFNLRGLKRNYAAARAAPVAHRPFNGPTLFIKGGQSDYILAEHRPQVHRLFPHASLKVMPEAGHWLHAQQPSLFNGIVGRFLDSVG
jgi:esterase